MLVAAESALESLSRRVLALRKLSGAVEAPLRLPLGTRQLAALNRIASGLGVRPFGLRDDGDPVNATSFEQAAFAHLAIDRELEALLDRDVFALAEVADAFALVEVETADGTVLNAYAGGVRSGIPVVIVPACGMPIELCESWMRELGRDHFVVSWETRGLFGRCSDFDAIPHDLAAQAEDVFAVMDHFDLGSSHLMGLCGGAVVALAAAAERSQRLRSISLWYGDYDLGESAPRTKHQRELVRLLAMIRAGRKEAASLQRLFRDPATVAAIRRDVAHLVLYPYADPELLYRYAVLNGAIMETDVRPLLAQIARPSLVVTSEDDGTAHPEGSRRVAETIPGARLHVEPHGDHLTLFDARAELAAIARDFVAQT